MADIWEKPISILAGNLNLGHSYLITTVKSSVYLYQNFATDFFDWQARKSISLTMYFNYVYKLDGVANLKL